MKKLLIITQKVDKNDPILGFFHRWILEFSKNLEKVTVICLEKGEYDLPENVEVLSLGKEERANKLTRLINLYKYIWNYRKDYESVFVHMNPIYIILCWKIWFILNKPIFLWYTHKQVDLKLRLSSIFVKKIFTASSESLRLKTKKKIVVGHGIETSIFKPNKDTIIKNNIISVGRITKSKNIVMMIEVLNSLPEEYILTLVGSPITDSDFEYEKEVIKLIDTYNLQDRVVFTGSVNNKEVVKYYQEAFVFINLSDTGSLDKAVLEAMSCNVPVITTNVAFKDLPVMFVENEKNSIVDMITDSVDNLVDTRGFIGKNHSLNNLIVKLIRLMGN